MGNDNAGENARNRQEAFKSALAGKRLPVLTLDNKWYKLLNKTGSVPLKETENSLNQLLKRQGKLNTESKEIRNLKKKLMKEIVPMVDEAEQQGENSKLNKQIEDKINYLLGYEASKDLFKEIEEHKRLIEECNEKLEAYEDELKDLPREIERLNIQLMMFTMECCYDIMKDNDKQIHETADWVSAIRIELKKRLIEKQQKEQQNQEIYNYMHDIFGAEVVNLFDMKYNPEQK